MRPNSNSKWQRAAALVGGLALALAALPASATTSTLKRSIQNLTQFPFDIATAPVVAGKTIYENMNSIDDSTGVRIAYPIPGFLFNTMVQVGGGLIRGVTGLIELVPGVVLLFSDSELEPLYDPVEDNAALYENDNEVFRVKLGVDYTSGG